MAGATRLAKAPCPATAPFPAILPGPVTPLRPVTLPRPVTDLRPATVLRPGTVPRPDTVPPRPAMVRPGRGRCPATIRRLITRRRPAQGQRPATALHRATQVRLGTVVPRKATPLLMATALRPVTVPRHGRVPHPRVLVRQRRDRVTHPSPATAVRPATVPPRVRVPGPDTVEHLVTFRRPRRDPRLATLPHRPMPRRRLVTFRRPRKVPRQRMVLRPVMVRLLVRFPPAVLVCLATVRVATTMPRVLTAQVEVTAPLRLARVITVCPATRRLRVARGTRRLVLASRRVIRQLVLPCRPGIRHLAWASRRGIRQLVLACRPGTPHLVLASRRGMFLRPTGVPLLATESPRVTAHLPGARVRPASVLARVTRHRTTIRDTAPTLAAVRETGPRQWEGTHAATRTSADQATAAGQTGPRNGESTATSQTRPRARVTRRAAVMATAPGRAVGLG
jgi:hypothetical protein